MSSFSADMHATFWKFYCIFMVIRRSIPHVRKKFGKFFFLLFGFHIFFNECCLECFQSGLHFLAELTVSHRVLPCLMVSRCRKSPSMTIIFLPNGKLFPMICVTKNQSITFLHISIHILTLNIFYNRTTARFVRPFSVALSFFFFCIVRIHHCG